VHILFEFKLNSKCVSQTSLNLPSPTYEPWEEQIYTSCADAYHGQMLALVGSDWDVMAYGDTREGKWMGNWRMEWVASTLHTTSEHGVSSVNTADAHISAASSRLNWGSPADLNGLIHFAERRNLVSARVPSHFKRSLPHCSLQWVKTVISAGGGGGGFPKKRQSPPT